MLTYSRSRGAFAGLTLEGAVVEQDADATVAIYGNDIPFRKILMGEVGVPATAGPFMRAVADTSVISLKGQEAMEQSPANPQKSQPQENPTPPGWGGFFMVMGWFLSVVIDIVNVLRVAIESEKLPAN